MKGAVHACAQKVILPTHQPTHQPTPMTGSNDTSHRSAFPPVEIHRELRAVQTSGVGAMSRSSADGLVAPRQP